MASPRRKHAKLQIDEYDEAKRRWLEKLAALPPEEQLFTETQQVDFVRRYFVQLEQDAVKAFQTWEGRLEEEDRSEREFDLKTHFSYYKGMLRDRPLDLDGLVEEVCVEMQLAVKLSRLQARHFGSLLALAIAESYHRSLQRVRGERERSYHAMFEGLHVGSQFDSPIAQTPVYSVPVPLQDITLGELADAFIASKMNAKKATKRTYQTIVRVVKELLGTMPASQFNFDEASRFLESLKLLSTNLKKTFPGKSIREVIEINKRNEKFVRVSKKTLLNYLTNFSAMLNFGMRRSLITDNPLRDHDVRQVILSLPDDAKEREPFSVDDLNKLFRAPLYTGCVNGERGVNRPGPMHPRHGRFWLPLLSLFHGFRLNEVAQLYTEDVQCKDGVWHIYIRAETDLPSVQSTKILKTKQSKRRVPIHPELHNLGFLEYVEERLKDKENHHLFTDARIAATGYYSDIATKRFQIVLKAALPKTRATFHSFRHMFRDALREAGVDNVEDVEALGGWEAGGSRSAQRGYGKGPSISRLYEQISKVKYSGMDIRHLYPKKFETVAKNG